MQVVILPTKFNGLLIMLIKMTKEPHHLLLRSWMRKMTKEAAKKDIPKARLNPIWKPKFCRWSCVSCHGQKTPIRAGHSLLMMIHMAAQTGWKKRDDLWELTIFNYNWIIFPETLLKPLHTYQWGFTEPGHLSLPFLCQFWARDGWR